MGFFSRKLTSTQEAELEDFSRTLHTVRQQCEQAFSEMLNNTKDLVAICDQALKEDRDLAPAEFLLDLAIVGFGIRKAVHHSCRVPEQTVDMTRLIEGNKEALNTYSSFLRDMQAEVLALKPASWYPKKYKKVHDSWVSYFESILQFLDTAIGALQSPEPLKHDPRHGNDRLNIFVWALNSIAMFSQEVFIPADL